MLIKGALIGTTSTPGWNNVLQFADAVIQGMKNECFSEEDDVKAAGLRRDARGAEKFWTELITCIERTKAMDPPGKDNYLEIATD